MKQRTGTGKTRISPMFWAAVVTILGGLLAWVVIQVITLANQAANAITNIF